MMRLFIAAMAFLLVFGLQSAKGQEFEVWVFKWVNGKWAKQAERTLRTLDYEQAAAYVASVNSVKGWQATSNLPSTRPITATEHVERGLAHYSNAQYDQAIQEYDSAITLDSASAQAYRARGSAWRQLQHYDKAVADFEQSAEINAEGSTFNMLARLFATCPERQFRDGARAIELGTKACELSDWRADCIDTLAAANAETGHFDKALEWQRHVIGVLTVEGKSTIAAQARLNLYLKGKPYREYPTAQSRQLSIPTFTTTIIANEY